MPCLRGDVVLVPFPFSDALTAKRRPAVVISSDRFNATNLDVLVAAITHSPQAIHRPGAFRLSDDEPKAGGLADPLMAVSVVVASKLATIAQVRILETRGQLPPRTVEHIIEALLGVLR